MMESRHIIAGLGNVSLSETLGSYYIDMRPALFHYTDNIYGGGFDADGVPMWGAPEGLHYMPVNVLQFSRFAGWPSLFGLYDLSRVTGDAAAKGDIDACLRTLLVNLHRFDAGYWSTYDMQRKELVRYYYQKNVHVPQMAVLHRLSGEAIFDQYRDKWERQITPLNYLFVQLMYRVKPRLGRLRCMWHGTESS
jgi:D-glucuronyl C5-epimerase C-terminus